MLAGLDPRLRSAVGEILMGFALMNFGVVVAILAYCPEHLEPRASGRGTRRGSLGARFRGPGGNEFRK